MSNTFKIYGETFQQMLESYAENLLVYEIDREILQEIAGKFNNSYTFEPVPEYKLWFPPHITKWCMEFQIEPKIQVQLDHLEIVFLNPQDCMSFRLSWF